MSDDASKIKGNIVVCNRLRIDTDGEGVTTLVGMKGCPLKCKYCINKNLDDSKNKYHSVEDLFNTVKRDDIYFQESGGGICFGGHEPLLQSEYIREFKELLLKLGIGWKVYIETSLNVDTKEVINVISSMDSWIIDIKDMNPRIYEEYTGKSNELVKENLGILVRNIELHKIKIRLPLIEGYNSIEDREKSKLELLSMGFGAHNFDEFKYDINR